MNPPNYQYNGARSMVILHEIEMRKFVAVWKVAKESKSFQLPVTDDPSYISIDHLLQHVLRAARGYMVWMCENLGLPDPGISATPNPDVIADQVDTYLENVLSGWIEPLKNVPEERFNEVYLSRWKVQYCIDGMMEHAVMHPIRHSYQIENLMK